MQDDIQNQLGEVAKRVCVLLGLDLQACTFLRHASTFAVARLDTSKGTFVLRLEAPRTGKQAFIETDVAVRQKLASLDARIAAPVASSADFKDAQWSSPWVLDHYIDGVDGDTVDESEVPWAEMGEVLALVHSVKGINVPRGVSDRFQDAWPVCGKTLEDHPVAEIASDLVERLRPFQEEMQRAAQGPDVLLHGDPGLYNIRLAEGHLVGLLDFNDILVGPAVWDFAILSHYFGPRPLKRALEGYGAIDGDLFRHSRLLGLSRGLHRLSRSVTVNNKYRERRTLERLRFDLDEMESGH